MAERRGRGLKLVKAVHQWATILGWPLLPWQSVAVDTIARTHYGLPAYRDAVVSVPRQQGKTVLARAYMAAWADVFPGSFMAASAQKLGDARLHLIELGYSLIAAGIPVKINEGIGNELVRWPNGSELRIASPNRTGFHGWSIDFLLLDEFWSMSESVISGAIPARAARPGSQALMISTAGVKGESPAMEPFVEIGRAGLSESLAYLEWSSGPASGLHTEDLDAMNPAHWPRFMPAFGETVSVDSIMAARDVMAPHDFRRAFGNEWTEAWDEVIDMDAWHRAADGDLPVGKRVAVAVDINPVPLSVAIAAAWHDDDGTPCAEVLIHAPGAGGTWIPDRVRELARHHRLSTLVSTTGQPSRIIEPDMAAAAVRINVPFRRMNQTDLAAASMRFQELVTTDPAAVRIRPHPALTDAVKAVERKPMGDLWRFIRTPGRDVAPLFAVASALLAADEVKLSRPRPRIHTLG